MGSFFSVPELAAFDDFTDVVFSVGSERPSVFVAPLAVLVLEMRTVQVGEHAPDFAPLDSVELETGVFLRVSQAIDEEIAELAVTNISAPFHHIVLIATVKVAQFALHLLVGADLVVRRLAVELGKLLVLVVFS